MAQRLGSIRTVGPTHLEHHKRRAATVCAVLYRCKYDPLHSSPRPVHTAYSIAARTVVLTRTAQLSLSVIGLLVVSRESSSLSTDVKHRAIVSTSGSSSSMKADI